MFLQVVPKESKKTRELYGGADSSKRDKEEKEEQECYSILQKLLKLVHLHFLSRHKRIFTKHSMSTGSLKQFAV